MAGVLADSDDLDWTSPDPESTLYLELASGRVVFELAPEFAPKTIANIKQLVRAGFFDGLSINRVQENYVVQWGDPAAGSDDARPQGEIAESLRPEFYRAASGLAFTALHSRDAYAKEVGFVDGMPAGRDGASGRAWLAHCYGMLGVGRDVGPASGNGSELYVVIGHAPRHLDRNVTLVGRVLSGMSHLSTLPRGGGALGFYLPEERKIPIVSMRVAADVEASARSRLQRFRTDTPAFDRLMEARTRRLEEWFVDPAGNIELCNVPIPVRLQTEVR